jgi:hypothetical protein
VHEELLASAYAAFNAFQHVYRIEQGLIRHMEIRT